MSKGPTVDLLAIDLASGKHWLAEGRETTQNKIRQKAYNKHRALHLATRKQKAKQRT